MWTIRTVRAPQRVVRDSQTLRSIVMGGLIGVVVSGGLALPSLLPPAMAQDEPIRTIVRTIDPPEPKVIDGEAFAKPNWTVEPWVSTEARSERTVRKISFGRTEFVSIMTTDTGTYSSDGLDSAHVRYPGIHAGEQAPFAYLAYWDGGWVMMKPFGANSFVSVVPFKGGPMLSGEGACLRTETGFYC